MGARKGIRMATGALVVLVGAGCSVNPPPAAPAPALVRSELTAGVVQRDVRAGMSGADVVEVLGAPNVVTRGGDGREVWVWDRVSSDAFSHEERGSMAGFAAAGAGAMGGSASMRNGRTTSTQNTLTVVVRFDAGSRVSSVSLHASSF